MTRIGYRCRVKPHRQCRRFDLSPRGIFGMVPTRCPEQRNNQPCNREPVIAPLYLCEDCAVASYWKRITSIYKNVKNRRGVQGCGRYNAGCNGLASSCWETEGGTDNPIEVPIALAQKLRAKSANHGSARFDNSHSGQVKFRFTHEAHQDVLVHINFQGRVDRTTFFIHRQLP